MGFWDIAILAVVAAAALLAFRSARKSRRNGCACGCGGCPAAASCEKKKG